MGLWDYVEWPVWDACRRVPLNAAPSRRKGRGASLRALESDRGARAALGATEGRQAARCAQLPPSVFKRGQIDTQRVACYNLGRRYIYNDLRAAFYLLALSPSCGMLAFCTPSGVA